MKKAGLKRVLTIISLFGPAVLVSVELFDPASIVAATASGATFGFEVLWAAFYSGILLVYRRLALDSELLLERPWQ
jgi:Mn2+/Fe2+ NRAMP family transporter